MHHARFSTRKVTDIATLSFCIFIAEAFEVDTDHLIDPGARLNRGVQPATWQLPFSDVHEYRSWLRVARARARGGRLAPGAPTRLARMGLTDKEVPAKGAR